MHKIHEPDLAYAIEQGYKPKAWVPDVRNPDGKINPHVTQLYLGGDQYLSIFHIKPIYYETISGHWRPLSEVTVVHGNRNIVLHPDALSKMHPRYLRWLSLRQRLFNRELLFDGIGIQPRHMVFATSSDFYPDPHTETTTVDAGVGSRDASYATFRTGATLSVNDASTVLAGHFCCGVYFLSTGAKYRGDRAFMLFDTSSIPDTDTLDSATLAMTPELVGNASTGDNNWQLIVQSSPASNTAIATSDWSNCGPATATSGGSAQIDNSSFSVGTEYSFTLNATGISYIDATGITKLGVRGGDESSGTAPTGLSNATYNGVQWRSAEYTAGNTNDPHLNVVHSAAGGGGGGRTKRRHYQW